MGGGLKEPLSLSGAVASVQIVPNQEALLKVGMRLSHRVWDVLVVEPGNQMPVKSSGDVWSQVTSHHVLLGFSSICHFLKEFTQAVFSMIPVCDFLQLGVPLPPLPGVKLFFLYQWIWAQDTIHTGRGFL
jgi:hypothetical protein